MDASSKEEITAAIAEVRGVLESEDPAEINAKAEALQTAFHKVSEAMYANAAAQQQADAGNGAAGNGSADGLGRRGGRRRRGRGRPGPLMDVRRAQPAR